MSNTRKINAEPREGYISIEEFIKIAGVKEGTIKRNKYKIPGLSYEDDEYLIIEGTRYPFKVGLNKMENTNDRRYLLLRAISENKYIDHKILRIYHQQFLTFLAELLEAGLIRENNMQNHYGANYYDCTEKGDRLLIAEDKNKIKLEIANEVAKVAATLIGTTIGCIVSCIA